MRLSYRRRLHAPMQRLFWTMVSALMISNTVFAQTSVKTAADSDTVSMRRSFSTHSFLAGHNRLDFAENRLDFSAVRLIYRRFVFGKPVYPSVIIGGQWAEQELDSVSLKMIMADLSAGVACNVLGIPTLDRYLETLIPGDVSLCLGSRFALDFTPYYLERRYREGFETSESRSDDEKSKVYIDNLGWSYSFFIGVIIDKSIGLTIERSVTEPLSGKFKVSRASTMFGIVYTL